MTSGSTPTPSSAPSWRRARWHAASRRAAASSDFPGPTSLSRPTSPLGMAAHTRAAMLHHNGQTCHSVFLLCLQGTGVDVFACHPGLVDSELYSKTDASEACLVGGAAACAKAFPSLWVVPGGAVHAGKGLCACGSAGQPARQSAQRQLVDQRCKHQKRLSICRECSPPGCLPCKSLLGCHVPLQTSRAPGCLAPPRGWLGRALSGAPTAWSMLLGRQSWTVRSACVGSSVAFRQTLNTHKAVNCDHHTGHLFEVQVCTSAVRCMPEGQ